MDAIATELLFRYFPRPFFAFWITFEPHVDETDNDETDSDDEDILRIERGSAKVTSHCISLAQASPL